MSTALDGLEDHYDVVVLGVGPVGALAANLTGRCGLRTLAVDQAPAPYHLPRAMGIDDQSLRLLQSVGVAQAIEAEIGLYRASEYRAASGAVLRRIVQPPEPYPLSWPPYATFVQPQLEAAARSALASSPDITLRLGVRAQLLDENGGQVRLRLSAEGTERDLTCRYLLACDGASSPVRERLGIPLEDMCFDEPWLVTDIIVDDPGLLPDVNIQSCDPARPSTYICGPGQLRRWEVMLLPGEEPAEMVSEASIRRVLAPWLPEGQGTIWRAATYRFHALVAKQWRRNNVFLLGDAAHQTPPFMAQGLNQGLRDAGNLCWKLSEVFHGRAVSSLLDTYETERRPATRHAIAMAKTLGRIICERDPAEAAERDRRMLAEMEAGQGVFVRQDLLQQAIGDGFILRNPAGQLEGGAGRAFPQPWVQTEEGRRRLDDALPTRWLLLSRPGWRPDAALERQAEALGVTFAALGPAQAPVHTILEEDTLISDWMARHDVAAVLVRPDHVVFGGLSGEEPEASLLTRLEQALRQPEVSTGDARALTGT